MSLLGQVDLPAPVGQEDDSNEGFDYTLQPGDEGREQRGWHDRGRSARMENLVLTARRWLGASGLVLAFGGCWGSTNADEPKQPPVDAGVESPEADPDACSEASSFGACCARAECHWIGPQGGVEASCKSVATECTKHEHCGPGRVCVTRVYSGHTPCGQFFLDDFSVGFCADQCPSDGVVFGDQCTQLWEGKWDGGF